MYCVWQVVKTSTIILNNPVYLRAREKEEDQQQGGGDNFNTKLTLDLCLKIQYKHYGTIFCTQDQAENCAVSLCALSVQ